MEAQVFKTSDRVLYFLNRTGKNVDTVGIPATVVRTGDSYVTIQIRNKYGYIRKNVKPKYLQHESGNLGGQRDDVL